MCCLGFAVIGTAEALEARQVRVGVYSNEPKIFTDATGKPSGVLIEVLESIAAKEGWKLEFVACDWQDCLDALKAGKIDLMPDVAYSPQRDQMFDFHKQPSLYSWSQLYARARYRFPLHLTLTASALPCWKAAFRRSFLVA